MLETDFRFNPGNGKITIATYDETKDWWVADIPGYKKVVFWFDCREDRFYLEFAEVEENGVLHWPQFAWLFGLIWDPWGGAKRLRWGRHPNARLWCDRDFTDEDDTEKRIIQGDMKLVAKLPMMVWTSYAPFGIVILPGKAEPETWHEFLGLTREEYDERNRQREKYFTDYAKGIIEQEKLHYAENQEQKEQTEKEWEEWEKRQAEGDDKQED
ncbi:MAG: hypothetical protein IJQ39_04685 [Thermoguttaceae bacterium]|nr:hypothetical protein [Thermoguttaceae bacterium]